MALIPNPLELPAYIGKFVKICRAVKEYKELDATYRALMDRAIANSDRLNVLTKRYGRESSYYQEETWNYIQQMIAHAKLAMDRTLNITTDWKEQLGVGSKENTKAKGSAMKKAISTFASYVESKVSDSKDADSKEADKVVEEENNDPSFLQKQLAIMQYMVIGKVEIMSSMRDLERWLYRLNLAILTSGCLPAKLERVTGTSDSILFVARAKKRISKGYAVDFIDKDIFEPRTLSDIDPESPTGIYRVQSGPYAGCILDPRYVIFYAPGQQGNLAWKETGDIATMFAEDVKAPESQLPSSVGILPSCGYTELDRDLLAIVFRYPTAYTPPRTLRSLLLEQNVKHSLSDRVRFAIRLATSVLVVHSLGFVHRNIKPDSILVAGSASKDPRNLYPYKLGTPFLLSIDSARVERGPAVGRIYEYPAGANWVNVYTHPRHLAWFQPRYEMRDDIYSLGVCLLEIALWKSLFQWNPAAGKYGEHEDVTDEIDLSQARLMDEARSQGKPTNVEKSWLKQCLMIEATKELVPAVMGDLFRDVIIACLTFGDTGKISRIEVFADRRSQDISAVPPDEQSIRFVREVVTKLDSINLS